MNLYLGWALGAAIAWGSADYCAKKAAERFGFWPSVWSMNAVGALAMAVVWLAGAAPLPHAQIPRLALLAVGNAVGGVFFYFALEHGPLVVVSPVTAAYPVVSAVLAYFVSGERLGAAMLGAVAGVIAGTLLASSARESAPGNAGQGTATRPYPQRRRAIASAVLAALTFGAVFYALAAGARLTATATPVLVFRWVGAIVLALPLLFGRRLPPGLFRSGWTWATGLLDSLAYLLYAEGAKHLAVSVTSALSGLFTVWTLVLAVVFLGERLGKRQWLGVALIIAGIALLAVK